jgi:hypothetical protein
LADGVNRPGQFLDLGKLPGEATPAAARMLDGQAVNGNELGDGEDVTALQEGGPLDNDDVRKASGREASDGEQSAHLGAVGEVRKRAPGVDRERASVGRAPVPILLGLQAAGDE